MGHADPSATDAGMEPMKRHRWDRSGPFTSSKDVRTCQVCGVKVTPIGQWYGRRLTAPDGRSQEFQKMQPCPWPPKEEADAS